MVDYSETVDVYDIKVSINNEYMKIHVGHRLTKGPYDQNWKFESNTCFKTSIHVEPSLKISMIYRQRQRNYMLLNWYSVPSLRTSFLNIKTLFNVTPFHLYDVEHDGAVQHYNSNIWVGIPFFFMCVDDYPFEMNKFCCHGALFLRQFQHYMNMGCFSNTVPMATVTWF